MHYERDELDEAARHIRPSTEYYELVGSRYQVQGYALLVDLNRALGEFEAARECLDKLVQIVRAKGFSLPDTPVAAMVARQRLLLSRADSSLDDLFADAVRWAETVGLEPDGKLTYGREYEFLTLAQVRIAQGRAAEALPLLERLVAAARGAPAGTAARKGQLVAFLAVQAVAHHACDRNDAAQEALSRTLALGEPEGYVRTFLDLGPPMHDLLRDAARQSFFPHQAYVSELLEAFSPGDTRADTDAAIYPQLATRRPVALVEPFNDREMQVLRLLAAGLTDLQISEELYLSINTVKWYNRQIYSKLGVGRRGQAVARAQELGLL